MALASLELTKIHLSLLVLVLKVCVTTLPHPAKNIFYSNYFISLCIFFLRQGLLNYITGTDLELVIDPPASVLELQIYTTMPGLSNTLNISKKRFNCKKMVPVF